MTDEPSVQAIQRVNFAQLRRDFYIGAPGARSAAAIISTDSRKGTRSLQRLLRHHSASPISDPETWDRDGFDYLLGYYALVELGCLSGYLNSSLPTQFVEEAYRHLSHPAVQQYYEEHYPVRLPTLLRLRLEHKHALFASTSPQAYESFVSFLEASRPIELGTSVETFLWFLDGGRRAGYDIDDTIATLSDPEAYLRHISHKRKSALDKSLIGFHEFLRFCEVFYAVLLAVGALDLPEGEEGELLASGYWHYHAYWFRALRKRLRGQLYRALDAFSLWEASGPQIRPSQAQSVEWRDWYNSKKEVEESSAHMKRVLEEITADAYGKPLLEAIRREYGYKLPYRN